MGDRGKMSVNAVVTMEIITAQEGATELLERLLRLGGLAVQEPPRGEKLPECVPPAADVEGAGALAARLERVLPVLSKHANRRRLLFAPHIACPEPAFRTDGRYDVAMRVVEECEKILAREEELDGICEKSQQTMKCYEPYLDWNRRLDFTGTAGTEARLGQLPQGVSPQTLLEALEGRAAIVQLVCDDRSGRYIFVLAHHSEAAQTFEALEGIGFRTEEFPSVDGTARELFDRAARAVAEAKQAKEGLGKRLFSLSMRLDLAEQLSANAKEMLSRERRLAALADKTCVRVVLRCPDQRRERALHLLERAGAYVKEVTA